MTSIVHPNFRIGPGQKNVAKRTRTLLFPLSQEAFDAIMTKIALGQAESSREVLARAIEEHLGLAPRSADPADSTSGNS
ncbi:MAG: hypothetical protein ACXWPM_01140 [Bdellovibrionota bacterium]